jgi:MraZ protein
MARGLDGFLAVYPTDEFQRLAAKLGDIRERGPRERQAARSFFSGAVDFTPDKQGRVAIPMQLREYAHLDKDVVVAGGFDHIEIWDALQFRARDAEGIAALADGEGMDDFI